MDGLGIEAYHGKFLERSFHFRVAGGARGLERGEAALHARHTRLLIAHPLLHLCGGGLVFKAHRLLYHSTLGWRVIKKKKKIWGLGFGFWGLGFGV